MPRMPSAVSNTLRRGRDQRSRRRSTGTARLTARSTSFRATDRASRALGSQGEDLPIAICTATSSSSRPQTNGIGGGIGRQFGKPSSTTSSAKARSLRTATMSPTVRRSPSWLARTVRTSDVRAPEYKTRPQVAVLARALAEFGTAAKQRARGRAPRSLLRPFEDRADAFEQKEFLLGCFKGCYSNLK